MSVVVLEDGGVEMDEMRVFLKVKGSRMQAIRPDFVESLPRNPACKVLERDLQKQDS